MVSSKMIILLFIGASVSGDFFIDLEESDSENPLDIFIDLEESDSESPLDRFVSKSKYSSSEDLFDRLMSSSPKVKSNSLTL